MQGWECPRCHRILSPLKESCSCSGYGSSVWPTYIYSSTSLTPAGACADISTPRDSTETFASSSAQMTPGWLSSALCSDDALSIRLNGYANLGVTAPDAAAAAEDVELGGES